ncbi:hypothetical protein [Microbulbifer yueqingensis]|uniref:Uncharacterized protein n=1 Tax=Microbulbifer yueqingensis TaxID=658219 RepID=A0A1G9EFX8_9GAMM|nr:hypothetical protein [Microbulbifer yueqingensis]SDK74961.1 hypothetical protein SAMN05216212_3105 [Microbulbifer yueqingensis]
MWDTFKDIFKGLAEGLRTDDEGRTKATEAVMNSDMPPDRKADFVEQAENHRHQENSLKIVGAVAVVGVGGCYVAYKYNENNSQGDTSIEESGIAALIDD